MMDHRVDGVRPIEEAMIATWPALTTVVDGGMVLRMADGFTGRANAVTFLDPGDGDRIDARIDWACETYRRHGLAAAFRETPLTPPAASAALAARGFRPERETLVLVAGGSDLVARDAPPSQPSGPVPRLSAMPGDTWIAFQAAHDARLTGNTDTFREMMRRAAGPMAAVEIVEDGVVRAAALAARHRTLWTVHDVLTEPDSRGRGLARLALAAALSWGLAGGTDRYWIAVTADNERAIGLYRSLGFRPAFRYRYLVSP